MGYIAIFLTIVGTPGSDASASQKAASTGAVVMIYISGFGWAMGWNSIQYLMNAEIYPLRIRAVSSSFIMMVHFANQYGSNRAVPIMLLDTRLGGLGGAGSFWFFTVLTIIGGIWAWFFIPETAGRSLESMDRLFTLKWYQIGRHGEKEADVLQHVHDEKLEQLEHGAATQVERVEKV
jgi:hypothetical protein